MTNEPLDPKDREKRLRRLRKIMALTESSNPGEAAAALQQARTLMDKYGLDAMDAEAAAFEESTTRLSGAKVLPWEGVLISIIQKSLGVKAMISGYVPQKFRRRPNAEVIFVGEGPRAELASYAFTVLRRKLKDAIESARRQLQKLAAPESTDSDKLLVLTDAQRKSYAISWCLAVESKVNALYTPANSAAMDRYIETKHNPKKPDADAQKTRRPRQRKPDLLVSHLAGMGIRDGRGVALHQAMNGQEQRAALPPVAQPLG